MHFQGSQLYPGRPRSGHILQAHLSLYSPLPSTGQQYREAIQAIQYTQRLLLRLPGRRPSLHQKGYEGIHKWGSEREPANPERKQQNRTRQQGPVLRTCPECGLSEGRLTLELSVLPPPLPITCRSALGPHICMEKAADRLRCLLSQGDQEAVRVAREGQQGEGTTQKARLLAQSSVLLAFL